MKYVNVKLCIVTLYNASIKYIIFRNSSPEVFWGKGVLKIYSKFTGEHPCRNVISIKLLCNFIEIPFRHVCSPVNLLFIFSEYLFLRTPLECCFCNSSSKSMYSITARACSQIFELIFTHVLSHFKTFPFLDKSIYTLLTLLAQSPDPSVALDLSTMRPFFYNKYLFLSNINWRIGSDTVLMLELSGAKDRYFLINRHIS